MRSTVLESFSINLRIMRALRLYPPATTPLSYTIQAYFAYFTFIILVPTLAVLYLFFAEDLDVVQLNYNAAFVAQSVSFITKLLPFITNSRQIRICINYFDEERYATGTTEEKKIVDECVWICRRNSIAFTVGVTVAVFIWNIRPLFWGQRELPLEVWLPFDTKQDIKIYCGMYAFLVVAVLYVAFAGTTVDPLIGGLACHASGQLQILKYNLQRLGEDNNTSLQSQSTVYRTIKKCIMHHEAILRFRELYENCFSLSVFSQFAASAFSICFCSLQLNVMDLWSVAAVSAILCVFVVLGEIYFYCYYGTLLFEENKSLADAIYMGKWYELDEKSKKALVILMERSKKPMVVTAGKVLDLTLATFTTILKRTYSLLALLENYQ